MDFDRQAADIIGGAEKALAALAARAASGRDYAKAAKLLGIAQRVAASGDPLQITNLQVFPSQNIENRPEPNVNGNPTGSRPQPPRKNARTQYPIFRREENTLIKIGWSKSDGTTYEHRSPREMLVRLTEVVADLGAKGRRFATDRILPPHESRLADAPTYQVYLCLAFLVLSGLVKKHGRSGYTIAAEHAGELATAAAEKWNQLPVR